MCDYPCLRSFTLSAARILSVDGNLLSEKYILYGGILVNYLIPADVPQHLSIKIKDSKIY